MADDNTRIVKTKYVAELDTASYRNVTNEIKSSNRSQIKAAKDTLNLNEDIRKSLLRQEKARKDDIALSEKQTKAEKSRLDILEAQNSMLRRQVGSIGDVDTALSAIRGGTSAFTGTSVPGLEQAAAVFEVTEALGQLKAVTPLVTEQIKTFANSLTPRGVGLAAVAGVAVVAVGAAAKAISDRLVPALADMKRQTEANIEAQKTLADELASGATTDEITQSYFEFARLAEVEANKLDIANQKLAEYASQDVFGRLEDVVSGTYDTLVTELEEQKTVTAQAAQAAQVYADAIFSGAAAQNDAAQNALDTAESLRTQFDIQQRVNAFIETATQESFDSRVDALNAEIDLINQQKNALADLAGQNTQQGAEAKEAVAGFNDQLSDLQYELGLLTGTAAQTVAIREDQRRAEEAATEASKEYEQVQRQRESTLSRLISLEEQSTKAVEQFALKQSELVIDRTNRDSDRLEDFNDKREQEFAEHNRELLSISREGNRAITEARQAVIDFDKEYMQSQIAAHEEYRDELKKLNRQRDLQELQERRDHLLELAEAEQANDVVAFLRAEQQFKNQQQKRRENESLEDKERRDQLQKTLDDNRRAYLERRALLQQEVRERQQQLQESIAAEREKYRIEQDLAQQAFDKQLERQQRDDQIADQRSKDALRRTLNEINIKARAEITAIQKVTSATAGLEAVANRIANTASRAGASSANRSSSYGSQLGSKSYEQAPIRIITSAGGGATGFAFASGGITRGGKPQLAVVGDSPSGIDEAHIPFRRSQGLPKALEDYGIFPSRRTGQGAVVHLNFAPNLTVGDIASASEVTRALQDFAGDLDRQVTTALNRAVNQAG